MKLYYAMKKLYEPYFLGAYTSLEKALQACVDDASAIRAGDLSWEVLDDGRFFAECASETDDTEWVVDVLRLNDPHWFK